MKISTPLLGLILSCSNVLAADTAQTCQRWKADVIDSRTGKVFGIVLTKDDTYNSVAKAIESERKSDKSLCHFFGPTDSQCYLTYTRPYCADNSSSKPREKQFLVHITRKCVLPDGTVKGKLSVNDNEMGDVSENKDFLIASGTYKGSLRYTSSQKENVQGPFGTLGDGGGDFLLQVEGVPCRGGGLEFHGGTYARQSRGCVLLGPIEKDSSGVRDIPDPDTHLLSRLRQEFYGTNLPRSTPNTDIQITFEQPANLPTCGP